MNRWFILPGMGATPLMYDALNKALPFEVNFIDWPDYCGEKTYADVARRIISEYKVAVGDVVGGSSLGGMVALEIAKLSHSKAVILMGSAIKPQEVQRLLALMTPLAAITPISLIQLFIGKHSNMVSSMFASADPDFIRAMCLHLSSWTGYQGPQDKIYRLHGGKDHVIPCPPVGCDIVEDAGHLLAITHVFVTASFLKRIHAILTSGSMR